MIHWYFNYTLHPFKIMTTSTFTTHEALENLKQIRAETEEQFTIGLGFVLTAISAVNFEAQSTKGASKIGELGELRKRRDAIIEAHKTKMSGLNKEIAELKMAAQINNSTTA